MDRLADILKNSSLPEEFRLLVLGNREHQSSSQLDPDISKVTFRPVLLKNGFHLQQTVRRGDQEFHANFTVDDALVRIEELLKSEFRNGHLYTATQDYSIRRGKDGTLKWKSHPPSRSNTSTNSSSKKNSVSPVHNRKKNYLIPRDVPCTFLEALGIMTSIGRVKQKQENKFRQINRFLEFVQDIKRYLPADNLIRVVDFGCGKSYLTFALYHLIKHNWNREVQIVGLDLKGDVVANCQKLANSLGWQELTFQQGDLGIYDTNEKVHLTVSLHACDTATDHALAKAILWDTDVIFAVPCCQHELFQKMPSEALHLMTQHGIIKERFAALATDALRAKLLESVGYKVQVMEFIDLSHTAKNLLIRAMKKTLHHQETDLYQYRKFKEMLGIDQLTLESLLNIDEPTAGR